jgi:hypothetical protein
MSSDIEELEAEATKKTTKPKMKKKEKAPVEEVMEAEASEARAETPQDAETETAASETPAESAKASKTDEAPSKKKSSKSKFSYASNSILLEDNENLDSKDVSDIEKLQAEILKKQHELQLKIKIEA